MRASGHELLVLGGLGECETRGDFLGIGLLIWNGPKVCMGLKYSGRYGEQVEVR